ncbi:efflux RND transporter periplasmic adaptor subunit [Shewanella khirikhana]|uniref:efflux RND transporter periplasmic adaptor subunit n=1 Tax=Shewanella khirikhana TaxID=1965282 RepID=UPI0030D4BED5
MDKKITQPGWKRSFKASAIAAALFSVAAIGYAFSSGNSGSSQHVALQGLDVAVVKQGVFQDTLAVRGRVLPKTTVYLDSVAGGQVEERLVQHGDYVEKGQPLLRLGNTALQLEVMSREAQVTEQLNFLRNTQMTMETNRLNLKRDLLETELQIRQAKRRLNQISQLVDKGHIAKDDFLQLQEDLKYYEERRKLTLEQQLQENSIRQQQLSQLEDSAAMLQKNLTLARSNLDNLLVRAPVSGFLSELNVEVGESKERGARLGQIDVPGEFKLVVQLDEFYLNQVTQGMPVKVKTAKGAVEASISRVDNRVNQSQFQIEIALPADVQDIRRGQSIDAELVLGQERQNALLLKRGAFFSSSGGNWVYVVSSNGDKAEKRAIRLGKRNQDFFEVTDGLEQGEQVIVSGYGNFDKADTLNLR